MKIYTPLLFSVFVFAGISGKAQNTPPLITNITALADTILHQLNIHYDLADTENDNMEIFLNVSSDSGFTYIYNTSNATGSIGFPIAPGSGKRIEWYYPDSLSTLLPRLAVKLTADDRHTPDIQQIVDQIDTTRLRQNLQFIEGIRHRTTGPVHLQEVRDSLTEIFQRSGLQTRIHNFQFNGGYTGKNIVGRKPGAANDTRTFLVSGHYDTVDDSPGADDDGSAIAAELEILRVIAQLDLKNTVEFIGFDLEEAGLSGSEAYVVNGIRPYEDIAALINMDMISYYSEQPNSQTVPTGFEFAFPDLYARLVADSFRGNFIISTANTYSLAMIGLFDSMAARYVPGLLVGSIQVPGNGELIPDSRRSDQAAFWDSGYVALHISDGAETRNPNYHDPTDVIGTVNYTFMSRITKTALATLLNLAGPLHADVQVVPVSADPASGIWKMPEDDCRISISPNPGDGHFSISVENCGEEKMKFKIFSMDGKWLRQLDIQTDKVIDLDKSIPSGYYIIEISNSKNTSSKKIFVK